MEIEEKVNQYNLDRRAASRLLKVSVRTLDRYIKAKKVSSRVIGGRVWLSKDEVRGFGGQKASSFEATNVYVSTPEVSTDFSVDHVDNVELVDDDNVVKGVGKRRVSAPGNKLYQELYTEVKKELVQKQERLEMANYRVGQLENQVRNSMPMLEYHRENYETEKKEKKFKDEITERENLIHRISARMKYEKLSKRMYLVILLTLLALQPLWLLLINPFG